MDTTDIRRVRLQQLVDRHGTQADFIRSTGQNQSEISGLLKNKSFGEKKARKIEEDLGLARGWLDVPIDASPNSSLASGFSPPVIADSFDPIPVRGFKAIPVMGRAQLGDNGHFSEIQIQEGGDGYVLFPSDDRNAYSVKCVGHSMKPRIQDGEFAVIEPNKSFDPGDDVLVFAKDERVMIKRFLYRRDGSTHLVSINDAHPPIVLSDGEIAKIHLVAAVCRPKSWRETP